MRILTVDDSFDWLNIHSTELQECCGEDLEHISACSAFEAFNIYKEDSPFDLVITDLQMESDFEPLCAGEWLIKEIQFLNPNQKIMIVSSRFDIDMIANKYEVEYLSKNSVISDITSYQLKLNQIFA